MNSQAGTGGPKTIALVGNPNCGKTTLFNRLTGSRGKVGNMPGVTVGANRAGVRGKPAWELVDLPGTYSLYAQSPDERVTQEVLLQSETGYRPDVVALVLEEDQVRSGMFLVLQVLAWGGAGFVLINETERRVERQEQECLDLDALAGALGVPVKRVNFVRDSRAQLMEAFQEGVKGARSAEGLGAEKGWPEERGWKEAVEEMRTMFPAWSPAQAAYVLLRGMESIGADEGRQHQVERLRERLAQAAGSTVPAWAARLQLEEAGHRMERIRALTSCAFIPPATEKNTGNFGRPGTTRRDRWTTRIDHVLTHPVAGQLILALVFFAVFQAVYAWAAFPMDWVDSAFGTAIGALSQHLPEAWWSSLLLEGILGGIAGIVVFVPQIMILFGLTAALEATGYMARVGFLGDRFLQRLGLNGRSIVPLVGGMACAVPAVLAARTIPGKRERLLTILITPLMTCSARLPVYAFLIGFLVPNETVWGTCNLQGLFLFGLYVTSTLAALALAWLLHRGLPRRNEAGYTTEWPAYRWPRLKDIAVEMAHKGWTFVSSAGRVILVVSLVLWALARFGPHDAMEEARQRHAQAATDEAFAARDAALLDASFIGQISHTIEPIVRPLGLDGTMGIALLTSFAAREVFVGTLSTLYPTPGSETGNIRALQLRLSQEIHPVTGRPLLNPASALSLLIFYMFAMQCMSTVAIVGRELKSWSWALGQALGFTLFAYGAALLAYQLLS